MTISQFPPIPCPICQTGEMRPFSDGTYEFRYARKTYRVTGQHYAQCDGCGATGYLPNQRETNSLAIREFQKSLPDYVSPSDVLALREKYSLTQKQANLIFGGGANGFSKWERGTGEPAGLTARVIKAALRSPETLTILADIAGVDFPIEKEKVALPEPFARKEPAPSVGMSRVHTCTHFEYADDVENDVDDNELNDEDSAWTLKKKLDLKSRYLN